MKIEKDIFTTYLKVNNLKKTAQRREILNIFLNQEKHLSVDDIYAILKRKKSKIGYATVYRTLRLLKECNLAREVDLGDGKVRYEHQYEHEHHDHLICLNCGQSIEFLDKNIEKLQDKIAEEHNFNSIKHKLEIYGICEKCKKK